MDPINLVIIALVLGFFASLFVIEWYTSSHGLPTISERFQTLNRRMDKQLIAGIFFLFGALAGWFIAHFTT